MFTVVIPTMWRSWHLGMMFNNVINSPAVGEVILVDNAQEHRPAAFNQFLKHPKLRLIEPGRNMFVNPVWNGGMKQAKCDQICILSDDVLFDYTMFQQLLPHVTEDKGIFGLDPQTINVQMKIQIGKPIKLLEMEYIVPPLGYGVLMFLHKAAATQIPDDFKIFYGDNWLCCHNALKRKVKNYYISNTNIQTRFTTTSSSQEFQPHHALEMSKSEDIFAKAFGPGIYNIDNEIEKATELKATFKDTKRQAGIRTYLD